MVSSSLLIKNLRVWMIYSGSKYTKSQMSDRTWMVPMVAVVVLHQILIAIWLGLSSISVTKRYISIQTEGDIATDYMIQYSYECESRPAFYVYCAIWGYSAMLAIGIVILTFNSQKIASSHSEFGLLLGLSVMLPICTLLIYDSDGSGSTALNDFRQVAIIWFMTSFPLFMQFYPKAVLIYQTEIDSSWFQKFSETASNNRRQKSSHSSELKNKTKIVPYVSGINTSAKFVPSFDVLYLERTQLGVKRWYRGVLSLVKVVKKPHLLFASSSGCEYDIALAHSLCQKTSVEKAECKVTGDGHNLLRVEVLIQKRFVLIDFLSVKEGEEFVAALRQVIEQMIDSTMK
ncbi:hypothetical protein BCR33DRAFT_131512 [Rhizoclosmatium globosum]|uniref:G-protein coupled receptors family 3 profile domain-containing protein n=1 Tax=Rhizoclosmatium globosum TaxID=329046 RepID=A0A1Y2CHQ4_9FUNG|nr:hypothetical protein BCR33DRAFT_131512 [Rhizoclosmatium globosum]|eukprot:ORY46581.1 hypothetical protein BCR33DRAFT_131512 [Rhizoclosmatium globosum]